MAVFNMVASGSGGGEIKSATFTSSSISSSINTITTSSVPSWYLLVCDESAYGYNNLIIKIDSGAYGPLAVASISSSYVKVTRGTATVSIQSGKLRFATTSTGYFRGDYTLYYMD